MENEIVIHNENDLRSKIYTIRGMRVMLDFDLAEIYGYETKNFNRQVKNNIEKFDEDFMFQLNYDEVLELSRCNFCTSIQVKGIKGGRAYFPYAFTEQGIYMLMTVLRGDLAIKQSKILIRLFKTMKDFIIERENLIGSDEVARLAIQTSQNTKDIAEIKENTVTRAEFSKFIQNISTTEIKKDFLFLNGKSVEADLAYQQIYAEAKETIFVIDNYIGLKTLVLLKTAKKDVKITIFSDNIRHGLHKKELDDFIKEYPQISVSFKKTNGILHDRYIILDFGTENEKIYHCGASSKDAGNKVSSISTTADNAIYKPLIEDLLTNPELVL
ncbi:ORF6N domain-containing protein [bacterium]|nr:ORF6N domain-containing protein [bacterium]